MPTTSYVPSILYRQPDRRHPPGTRLMTYSLPAEKTCITNRPKCVISSAWRVAEIALHAHMGVSKPILESRKRDLESQQPGNQQSLTKSEQVECKIDDCREHIVKEKPVLLEPLVLPPQHQSCTYPTPT